MDQNQSEFLLEIEELLDQIYNDLDALRDPELDGRHRRELIDGLFRRVHSVKGSAASCGLPSVSSIAHELENLLAGARAGQIVLDDALLDICNQATDALSESLGLSAAGIEEASRSDLFEELRAATRGTAAASTSDVEKFLQRIPAEIWQKLTEAERYRLMSAIREGSSLFILTTAFDTARFDEEFFSLKEKLAEWGEVLSTSPTVDEKHPNKINFRILYASPIEPPGLAKHLDQFPHVSLAKIEITAGQQEQRVSISQTPSSVSTLANFIRTDLDTLDQLISSTHQLFRSTSNAFALANGLGHNSELEKLHQEIKASFLMVEEGLINLRMVALGPTLQRAVRAGKSAARLANKQIDFEVTGGGLRLDKVLADAISDPLIHLVRNAVDHGTEDANTRPGAGKPTRATIRLDAVSEGGRVRVRVIDDGRGIDPEVISAAAKRLGISDSGADLDFERSVRLIFRPGFTTVETVSDLSGRGVGLDVVENAVEQAGGELRVSSKLGVGTTFEIRLPVTFGLMDATVVVSGGVRYCIAASQTLRNGDDGDAAVASANAAEPPTQFSLQDLMGQSSGVTQTVSLRPASPPRPQASSPSGRKLISCQFASDDDSAASTPARRVGILVDQIEGTEKVLVRTLGRHAGRWYGIAGATELRDGTVALVLDLPRLLSGFE